MALKALPTQSDKLFLQNLVPELGPMEGDCGEDNKAWASARQSTEADQRRVSQIYSARTFRYLGPITEETTDANALDEWALHVFLCLTDAGNLLNADGDPLFRFKRGDNYGVLDMTFAEFQTAFGALHPLITRALRYAVWEINPLWDLRAVPEKKEEEKEGEGEE